MTTRLPIDALRDAFSDARGRGPVVISAPTGSGKSTRVPTWIPEATPERPVWVIEPRRVACRALASRVAELEGAKLGGAIGYRVRDDDRTSPETRVLFVTPGIALRQLDAVRGATAVILDELHERRMDVDLLLALLRSKRSGDLVVMSATFAGDTIAEALSGTHLRGEGRMYPVDVRYVGDKPPTREGLTTRVLDAVRRAETDEGDILVFLPGKAEIAAAHDALRGHAGRDVVPLHGGLTLREQSRVFAPTKGRKIVLSTNVAETSLTVPGVGVVIDSGLVRRTAYHRGRGFLALLPIAQDSADQRSGRAGRTGPGVCYRLYSKTPKLAAETPPEMHRESLVPLVLAAGAVGEDVVSLPFLDAPKSHAIDAAIGELDALGVWRNGALNDAGRALFGLPLDAHLGKLLIAARGEPVHGAIVDLVAALAVGRPMFSGRSAHDDDDDDLRASGCDAVALIRAVREGEARRDGLSAIALSEARQNRKRLRALFDGLGDEDAPIDREAIARVAIAADPRVAYVARRRKKHLAFANGGGELSLGRESAANRFVEPRDGGKELEAVVVLDSRALGVSKRERRVIATCAMPAPIDWLARAGLGRDKLAGVRLEKGRVVADIERVYAKRVLDTRTTTPEGAMLREAIATLFVRGSLFKGKAKIAEGRLRDRALCTRIAGTRVGDQLGLPKDAVEPIEADLATWTAQHLEGLGVEQAEDLQLLSPDDMLPEPLPAHLAHILEQEFPRQVNVGDALYEATVDLDARQVNLSIIKGNRAKPPPASYIPRYAGFKVCVEAGRVMHVVRKGGGR